MRLPTFLVIGAMKAGTTSLHEYLGMHPDVFVSDPKELDFFRADGAWSRGVGWYASHFADAGGARAVGESSPNYTKAHSDPDVAGRIAGILPDVRLVYLVRHPLERIVSMYRHLVGDGLERRGFAEAVLGDPDYVDTSRYGFQLAAFREHFPAERILVLRSEDLLVDRDPTLRLVLEHIGVDPSVPAGIGDERNRTVDRRVPRRGIGGVVEARPIARVLDRSWRLRKVVQRVATRRVRLTHVTVPHGVATELRSRLIPDLDLLRELVPGFPGWPEWDTRGLGRPHPL